MATANSISDADTQKARQSSPKHVLIAGGGVIGISTAYYLHKHHAIESITVVDPTGTIAPAASGKAGGFLALDWNNGSPTQDLTHRSFALHQELADELGASTTNYRRLECVAVSVNSYDNHVKRPRGQKLSSLEWVQANEDDSSVRGMQTLGDTTTIAQVHPQKLCQRMWQQISKAVPKTQLIQGRVVGPVHDAETGRLLGARVQTEENNNNKVVDRIVEGDALLYACGPWTADMVQGVKYHSVVVPTSRVLSQCVFFSGCGDPEVYVRPDSTAYCTGFPEPERTVTERPGQECVRPDKIATLLESVRDASGGSKKSPSALLNQKKDNTDTTSNEPNTLSSTLQTNAPLMEQACYLPTTPDNLPVMGELPQEICGGPDCYIATGHGCWGILLGPATGECMAHLIMANGTTTAKCPVDLTPFDPKRFGIFQLVPNKFDQGTL